MDAPEINAPAAMITSLSYPGIAQGMGFTKLSTGAAAWMASKSKGASLLALIGVVLAYQLFGGLIEWAMTGSLASALQDWKLGWPGMLLQTVGGWLVLNYLWRK